MTDERPSIHDIALVWARSHGYRIPYKGSAKEEAYDEIATAIKEAGYAWDEIHVSDINSILDLTHPDRHANLQSWRKTNAVALKASLLAIYERVSPPPEVPKREEKKVEAPLTAQEKYQQELDDIEDEEPIDPSEQEKPDRKRLTEEEQEEIDLLLGWRK